MLTSEDQSEAVSAANERLFIEAGLDSARLCPPSGGLVPAAFSPN